MKKKEYTKLDNDIFELEQDGYAIQDYLAENPIPDNVFDLISDEFDDAMDKAKPVIDQLNNEADEIMKNLKI
jgi:hypothetical protein